MLIGFYDGITGKQIVREATAEEIAEREAEVLANEIEEQAKAQAQAEDLAKRQALLDRLGITEEEAKLLLA
jgi:hypothetical protein